MENEIRKIEVRINKLTQKGEMMNIRLINKLKRKLRKLRGEN